MNQRRAVSAFSQGLLRGEGLRGDHEQCGGGWDHGQGLSDVRGIDVGDEVDAQAALLIRPQGTGHHERSEVRSADPDVDDVGERRPAHAAVLATQHGLAEDTHAREHRAHRGHDILAVYDDGLRAAIAQGRMQHRPPFRSIDTLAREHTPDRSLQPRRVCQIAEQAHGFQDYPVLGVIEVEPGVFQGKSRSTPRVFVE